MKKTSAKIPLEKSFEKYSKDDLLDAIKDRHVLLLDDEHVLLKHQIDLNVIDAEAKKMGKSNPLVNDRTSDVTIDDEQMEMAKSFRRAKLYSPSFSQKLDSYDDTLGGSEHDEPAAAIPSPPAPPPALSSSPTTSNMVQTRNILVNVVKKYIDKDPKKLTLADIGTGNGRYALYLSSYFDKVIGVDKNPLSINNAKELAENHQIHNIEYFTDSMENLDSIEQLNSADILLFTSSFHFSRFDETFEAILRLKKKPLVVIKEPNEFTINWNTPAFRKDSSVFDKKLYDKKMEALEVADHYIKHQKLLNLIDRTVDKTHGMTVYVLKMK